MNCLVFINLKIFLNLVLIMISCRVCAPINRGRYIYFISIPRDQEAIYIHIYFISITLKWKKIG